MDLHLDRIFSALADPTRRAILEMLLEDDMAVTDVAEPFAMSLAAISKHLTILAEAGLIQQERRGRVKWCKLDPQALRAASVWMQGFGQFEPVDLDAFEMFLERELSDQGLLTEEPNTPPATEGLSPDAPPSEAQPPKAQQPVAEPPEVEPQGIQKRPGLWPFSRQP